MTADAAAAASNRLGRQTGVVWALLIIAHLLGAPLACVWHCQAGAGMAGMNHGWPQQSAKRISHQHAGAASAERASQQPAAHDHHHASIEPANRPAAMPAAASPGDSGHAALAQDSALPCAPLGANAEQHPTAIFPANLALAPALAPARRPDRLTAWDDHLRTYLHRPIIPPPRF